MGSACVVLQIRSCDQLVWLYIQHASLMASAYLLQSFQWGPWPCHPKNEIRLFQDQEIPQFPPKVES